jgi:ferredoxin-thioredoxin reductase catalytic subunit
MIRHYEMTEDIEVRRTVIEGLRQNVIKHGKPYCPCKLQKTEENVCKCDELKTLQVGEYCTCRLYKVVERD